MPMLTVSWDLHKMSERGCVRSKLRDAVRGGGAEKFYFSAKSVHFRPFPANSGEWDAG